MAIKVEREKVIPFKFESEITDQGVYEHSFLMKRRSQGLDIRVINTKSLLTLGNVPIVSAERQYIDTIATLMVYVAIVDEKTHKPVVENDGITPKNEWLDEILDQSILFAIHQKWFDYQASFYPKVEVKIDEPNAPEAPIQG